MNIDALVAEHLEPARRELERSRVLREQMMTAEVDIQSPDRTLTITQTCGGEVLRVRISQGAFDTHDENSLAKVIEDALKAARRAGRQVAEQLADQIMQEREHRRA
jgi:Uncharacterized protein conserved in bacteria